MGTLAIEIVARRLSRGRCGEQAAEEKRYAEGAHGTTEREGAATGHNESSEEFGTVLPGGQPMLLVDGSDLFFFGEVGFAASARL